MTLWGKGAMDILVNGQRDLVSVDPGSGLQDTLHQLRDWVRGEGLAILQVTLDGEAVTVDLDAGRASETVDAYQSLNLQVGRPADLAVSVLEGLRQMLPKLETSMREAAGAFGRGKPDFALARFPQILEAWEAVLGSVGQVCALCSVPMDAVSRVVTPERQASLKDAVLRTKQAFDDADFVSLADLLEYELAPMTGDWAGILGELQALVRATCGAGDDEDFDEDELDDEV